MPLFKDLKRLNRELLNLEDDKCKTLIGKWIQQYRIDRIKYKTESIRKQIKKLKG